MKVRWLMYLVTMFFLAAGIAGCGRPAAQAVVPVPTDYHLSPQSKMQSVYHWNVLAEDAAAEVRGALVAFLPDHYRPIFVAASGLAPFEKAFQELLITHLVKQGFLVSRDPQDAMILSFELQLVTHHPDRFLTNNEVLVTLSLTDGAVFIYRKSIGYYINNADWWHYRSGMQRRQQPAVSTFNLVDR